MEQRDFRFKFSIIMAVYKVEPYLQDAIESLVKQDIGFEESVELLLVDDGSPDGSGAICDEYVKKYPENVKVIHKENGGVSSARNCGIPLAQGRYVNFMDGDDMLESAVLSQVYEFFRKVDGEVDLVSIPELYFERKSGPHPLNYKYKNGKKEVIDVQENYTYVQMSLASAFVKNEVIRKHRFDSHLKYAEDAKVVLEILMENSRYGVVPGVNYLYRIRQAEGSALDASKRRREWYLNYLEGYTHWAIEEARRRFSCVPKFVQYTLMYDLQWRFRVKEIPEGVLSEQEEKQFKKLLLEAVNYIDDEIVMEQKRLVGEQKDFIIGHKQIHQGEGTPTFQKGDCWIQYGKLAVGKASAYRTKMERLEFTDQGILLEGVTKKNEKFTQELQAVMELRDGADVEEISCQVLPRKELDILFAGELLAKAIGFRVMIPYEKLRSKVELILCLYYGTHKVYYRNYISTEGFPISGEYRNSYYSGDGYLVSMNDKRILIQPRNFAGRIERSLRLWKERLGVMRKDMLACVNIRKE